MKIPSADTSSEVEPGARPIGARHAGMQDINVNARDLGQDAH